MRVALFGDINGEHLWLERLLRKTRDDGVDMHVCHGDITGKRMTPQLDKSMYCVDLLRHNGVYCLRGNHENEILSSRDSKYRDLQEFFSTRPERVHFDDLELMVSHLSPTGHFSIKPRQEDFSYLEGSDSVRICVFGHSHRRFIHSKVEEKVVTRYSPRKNTPYDVSGGVHLVNTGTTNIGFPVSLNILPGYVLYDSCEKNIMFRGLF